MQGHKIDSEAAERPSVAYSIPAIEQMKHRLTAAADTLRRVSAYGCFPQSSVTAWPDFVRSTHEAFGYTAVTTRLSTASAAAIDDLDRLLALTIERLAPDQRWLVWSKAAGVSWRRISIRLGCSRMTAWRRWMAALSKLT